MFGRKRKLSQAYLTSPSPPAPNLFCRLPPEVLEVIIEYVATFGPLESQDLEARRRDRLVELRPIGKTLALRTYDQPDVPRLNSLQALSAINKEMNCLCRPVLWRVSLQKFRSRWPTMRVFF